MTSRDEVRTLFAEANPVPDLDLIDMDDVRVTLDDLEQRSTEMVQQTERPHETPTGRRRAAPWLVAAAVLAVIAIAVVLTNLVGDGPPIADSVDTTRMETPDDPAVDAVVSAIEALNAGDAEAWASAHADPSEERYTYNRMVNGRLDSGTFYSMEWWVTSNGRFEIVEPCEVAQQSPIVVECGVVSSSDWLDPAGLSRDETFSARLNADLHIEDWTTSGCCDDQFRFNRAFYAWLREAEPDVFDRIPPVDHDSYPGVNRDPSDMATALEYVDEFIAQSDEYPLDG